MKIALCLSGALRNFEDTFYSFKHFVLDRYSTDVFFYGACNKQGVELNTQILTKLYQPKKYVINTDAFYNSLAKNNTSYMFYNILKCNDLKTSFENENNIKYDLVIRARPDCFWFRFLSDEEITLSKTGVLTPVEWSFRGVNDCARSDMFAIGSSDLMNRYSQIYNNIDEYSKTHIGYHPESLCGYHMQQQNISNIEYKRCIVFEYPSQRVEKYIEPYKFIKYFDEPVIACESEFLACVTNLRKTF
jgi:hypothetical protein